MKPRILQPRWINQMINRQQKFSTEFNQLNHTKQFLTSNQCRQSFIDYFVNEHKHEFFRSSPVKPLQNDQSLLFVNAGMNQFKSIFMENNDDLNEQLKRLRRVVNSQKCIRVGGKHCDLETVGKDFTHHTFFEMLGNWSFNDYFKQDACRMAWNLLTKIYCIDPKRLFVTIFAGNESLGLETDLETYEIWRSIGVPKNRILSLGMKDNFWEMGQTGPCGICTEIHYLLKEPNDNDVDNKQFMMNNSMEIWNLVFIQYFRDQNENLKRLNKNFVDTGMGLERILSLVQNVPNNYATDLFTPYFQQLQNLCKWPKYSHRLMDEKDIAYRILADHSRMISIAIADGIEPSDRGAGYLLRRVIRRASDSLKTLTRIQSLPVNVSETDVFLLAADTTIKILGQAFPELEQQSTKIFQIIDEELRLYSTAIARNTFILKYSKLLQIEINENYDHNQMAIIDCIERIDSRIDKIRKFQSKKNFLDNQTEIDQIRKDLQTVQDLITNDLTLSQRFGLFTDKIDKKFQQCDMKLIELENESNEIIEKIIQHFQLEASKHMLKSDSYTIISLLNIDFIPNFDENLKDFLMKIGLDLYGHNPLVLIMKFDRSNIQIQVSVPSAFQSKLDAHSWFQMAIDSNQFANIVQSIPTKRLKKMSKFQLTIDTNVEIIVDKLVKNLQNIGEKYF
ncbi:alanine--tRNA ligase, cytoplasmic-like [Dermatophagoides pteronyssinus]|uniref:alanine--tRNA ligase, cytoplasmic-like n=1 Tax=Dermatophagoides pteronyssinus TaxID=6956 RepID=UPI003F665A42